LTRSRNKGASVRRHREGIVAAVALLRAESRSFVSWRRSPTQSPVVGGLVRGLRTPMCRLRLRPPAAPSTARERHSGNRLFWQSWEASGPAIWCGRGAKRQDTPQSTSGESPFVPSGSFRAGNAGAINADTASFPSQGRYACLAAGRPCAAPRLKVPPNVPAARLRS
jgi:hypothetical protein